MSDRDEYEWEAQQDEYREEVIKEALENISTEGIKWYLHQYGDAIEARIEECRKIGKELLDAGTFGPSLVSSCTAMEVIIRYYILSPLVQGVFLYDDWADILANRVVSGRASEDRELLPRMLKFWGMDICTIKLRCGQLLWQTLHDGIWRARNHYVHRGDAVSEDLAEQAIEAAMILTQVAEKVHHLVGCQKVSGEMAERLGYAGWAETDSRKDPFAK